MNDRRHGIAFRWWHETVLAVLLLALLLLAEWLMPNFLAPRGQLYLSRHLWEFAMLALGMTLIIITGGIDLSVGSAMGLCAVAFGISFEASQSVTLAAVVCLLVGLVGGSLNGLLIARFKLHPLIVTLATYAAFRGVAEGVSQGQAYSGFGEGFAQLSRGSVGPLPYAGLLFLLFALAFGVFLARSATGRFLYAIGHNEQAARFSGILVERIKFGLYALSGLLAGLATIVYVSRFNTAKADTGKGFELDVITAVVVGGTSIFGGRGNIVGTTLGLLLIHETRLFVSQYWGIEELKPMVIGSLLIVSVLAYRVVARRQAGSA
jgi:rhamnose transport system permease protein